MFNTKPYLALIFFGLLMTFNSCEDRLERQELIYSNDFSGMDLTNIENGKLFDFMSDTVMGHYHNEEVSVSIANLPSHNVIQVTVELLIHDSWDGNLGGMSGPDFWYMEVDEEEVFRTTFSNTPCEPNFCFRQSYPHTYFRQNDPKTGAIQTNMPGLCLFAASPNYTTRYRISNLISHKSSSVKITLGDELKQINSPDPVCDESWSVAKIELTTMVVN